MGYIRHHAIVVTGWDKDELEKTRGMVTNIINEQMNEPGFLDCAPSMVTPIIESKTNGYATFFIGPDGSKEGWGTSENGDIAREKIVHMLKSSGHDYCEISYGDEAGDARILNES